MCVCVCRGTSLSPESDLDFTYVLLTQLPKPY